MRPMLPPACNPPFRFKVPENVPSRCHKVPLYFCRAGACRSGNSPLVLFFATAAQYCLAPAASIGSPACRAARNFLPVRVMAYSAASRPFANTRPINQLSCGTLRSHDSTQIFAKVSIVCSCARISAAAFVAVCIQLILVQKQSKKRGTSWFTGPTRSREQGKRNSLSYSAHRREERPCPVARILFN